MVSLQMALYLDTTIHPAKVSLHAAPRACIKSETFDITLLILPLATGLGAAAAVLANPALFALVLVADLWLLGYHHVVATYTRLAFTKDTLRRNRFLAVDLLLLMTAATLALAFTAGAWVIATAFLYLQWFHYMRQGYGLARMYFRATPEGQGAGSRDLVTDLVIYLVPVYGIAARSATMGDHVSRFSREGDGVAAGSDNGARILRRRSPGGVVASELDLIRTRDARYPLRRVRAVSRRDLSRGLHRDRGCQHWLAGDQRLAQPPVRAGGLDDEPEKVRWRHRSGSTVPFAYQSAGADRGLLPELRRDLDRYVWSCSASFVAVLGGGLAITVGIYMGINFHHYIVDALIWKRRRVAPQSI